MELEASEQYVLGVLLEASAAGYPMVTVVVVAAGDIHGEVWR